MELVKEGKPQASSSAHVLTKCGRFQSVVAKKDYVVTKRIDGQGRTVLEVREYGGSEVLAEMKYRYFGDEATMLHVEAYSMPPGTGVTWLLFFLFAKQAKQDGKGTVTIGTGVTAQSAVADSPEARAVYIYTELGFNAQDAYTLSHSSRTVDHVQQFSLAKVQRNWLQANEDSGRPCFLTSACTVARNLPDDCEELTVLRGFRDNYLRHMAGGKALVNRYYQIAPLIVSAINRAPDRETILDAVFQVIRACVAALKESRFEEALQRYGGMVRELEYRFCANEALTVDPGE